MRVVLLGTGSADGWPNPFCRCESCEDARASGHVRGHTAALVDDVLMLDCGPDAPRAAARLGLPLDRVAVILLTHAHPDHVGPAALLWRHWAAAATEARGQGRLPALRVLGPQGALDLCRDWVGPDDGVTFEPVAAGDEIELAPSVTGRYVVRVLPAAHGDATIGEAVLYRVTGPEGDRLLYATDTGPLPEQAMDLLAGERLDLALIEETYGDWQPPSPGPADHLGLTAFGEQLQRLRQVGALDDRSQMAAIHLGHHNPPHAELARRLSTLGARLPEDGTVLHTASDTGLDTGLGGAVPVLPPLTLVTGGASSGKSAYAEQLLGSHEAVTYVATGVGHEDDAEWQARVRAHQQRRSPTWSTVETTDVPAALAAATGPVLLDCLSLWLTAVLDDAGAWNDVAPATSDAGRAQEPWRPALDRACEELVGALRDCPHPVVVVTNEVGSGVVPASGAGRIFRDELGRLNARVGRIADDLVLCVAGRAVRL
ncbi:MAG: bifunctional adenosylcobinamide kinase/adenosylcobinamide-phosphate guanylyltransferase [Actinomycetes bacterium]